MKTTILLASVLLAAQLSLANSGGDVGTADQAYLARKATYEKYFNSQRSYLVNELVIKELKVLETAAYSDDPNSEYQQAHAELQSALAELQKLAVEGLEKQNNGYK